MDKNSLYSQFLNFQSKKTVKWAEKLAQIKGDERGMTTKCYKAPEIHSWSKKTKSHKRQYWDNW